MMMSYVFKISEAISLSNNVGIDILLDCSSDWDRYIEIIKNFNITNKYKAKINLQLGKLNRSKFNNKSININHYHHLYNELVKSYGI